MNSNCKTAKAANPAKQPAIPLYCGDLLTAVTEFETALPGWWFTVGGCALSRDASCGPDRLQITDEKILNAFHDGFDADLFNTDSTMADALRNVTRQALEALAEMNAVLKK